MDLAHAAVTESRLADNSVTSPKIADGSVTSADLAAAARGAQAFGYYTNFLSRSKNVVAVTNPSDGLYCIELDPSIDTSTATLVPSPEFASDNTSEGGDQVAHAEWYASATDCPAGQMEVRTYLDEQKTQRQNVSGCTGCTVNDTYRDLVKVDQGFSFVVP